jgi:DNA-binding MarR family transcriptional regulator
VSETRPAFREGPLLQVFVAGRLSGELLRRELGTTIAGDRFAVLSVIGALAPITPTELARRVGMAPTTVSSWLARLEREGVTTRRANPHDGRSQLIELSDVGRAELQRAMPEFARAVTSLRAALADDLEGVLDALDRLVGALRAVLAEDTIS